MKSIRQQEHFPERQEGNRLEGRVEMLDKALKRMKASLASIETGGGPRGSQPAHSRKEASPPLPFRSSGTRKVLPMHLETKSAGTIINKYLETIPTLALTKMQWTMKLSKASVSISFAASMLAKSSSLPTEKPFRSMGEAEVICYFAHDEFCVKYKVRFNIFAKLAAPVIFGRQFLDKTQTLTVHTDRLKAKDESLGNRVRRIMHFKLPRRRMQCSINGTPIFAHADTGAEMNLVSPSFTAKRNGGSRRSGLTNENLLIQLADGSTERITASFEGDLSLGGYGEYTNIQAKFYVLPGLTSDVLIGEDTLAQADVFGKHVDAFVDIFDEDEEEQEKLSLNIIKWLTEIESRILSGFRGRKSVTTSPVGGTPLSTTNLPNPTTATSPKVFRAVLTEADARELDRRDRAESRIDGLSGRERSLVVDAERARAAAYDEERALCLALHQQRLNAER